MLPYIRNITLAAAGAIAFSASAHAADDATGIWTDHNGRAAIEIAPCGSGNGLCGYVIHLYEKQYADRCGMQILGNVTSSGGGWVYSPDRGKKYSVELTRLSDDKLRVVGNAGSFFSKTYTWKRASDSLARCDGTTASAPEQPAETETAAIEPERKTERKAKRETEREPSTTRSLGSPSGSMALMGAPKKRRVAEAKAETITDADPAPAETEPVTKEKSAKEPEKTATAPERKEETFEPETERKCKYKIPYVGRVISVPCRD
jgi:uncharacterized protein (DUF2147 family)